MTASAPPPEASARTCHHCGSSDLEISPSYAGFHRVTSDCKPWPAGGLFARCRGCGLVQTVVTPEWSAEADRIYAGYTIYHQSGGSEQRVFDGRGGSGQPRSQRIIGALRQAVPLPARGRLLDLGCGNGSFLSAWSELIPGWSLAGSEVSEKYKREVESIPGVERLYTGDLDDIPGTFDAISLIHVLEHIPSPAAFLRRLRRRLAPGGLLILEVPDCGENPYILLVADHCSHFTPGLLGGVAHSAGFEVLAATNSWVAKEVSVVARRPADELDSRPSRLPDSDSRRVFDNIRVLESTLAAARPLSNRPDFGLFGTAIAATWLDAQLGGAARFFVDEDPGRVGKQHLGRPILAPADIPRGATVFVGLPPVLSGRIAERLRQLERNLEVALPPA